MKTSIYFFFLVAPTIFGCGQVDYKSEDLATRNDLLLKSINADYERFENTPIYRRTKAWYPKRLQPLFRFLTDQSKLNDNSLQQQRLDTLRRLTNQILNYHEIIKEPTISLCKDQLATIQNKLDKISNSKGEIEAFRNEVLQLEKIILYSDLQEQHHMSLSLIDTLGIKVIPESEVVKLGEPFKAKVYFASYMSLGHEDIIVYQTIDTITTEGVNPIDTFEVKRGQDGYIEFYPEKVGKNSIGVVWPLYTNGNDLLRFVTTVQFNVEK